MFGGDFSTTSAVITYEKKMDLDSYMTAYIQGNDSR
jgi:hypothetical protein